MNIVCDRCGYTSHYSQWDEWVNCQVAIAQYLDSLQFFAALCEARNLSSPEMLPYSDAEEDLYVLL